MEREAPHRGVEAKSERRPDIGIDARERGPIERYRIRRVEDFGQRPLELRDLRERWLCGERGLDGQKVGELTGHTSVWSDAPRGAPR